MTLIWHDWFATSNDSVGDARLMIDQNQLFRQNALGSFRDLLMGVTKDPAMLIWLNGIENRKRAANENYARELMELFTLGAGRGAYTEQDVRQLALALTGWRADWVDPTGWANFRYDDTRHDHSTKTVFGKSGDFDWQAAVTVQQDAGLREPTRLKEISHAHTERLGDPPQRGDARTGAAPLDLAEKALAQAGALGDLAQGASPGDPNRAQALADIDLTRHLGDARRHRSPDSH